MNPKVSVIIPNYNHAKFLQQRIESVLGQTFQDFELILMDDCSTDNSREVIKKYENHHKIKIIYNEVNSGSTFRQWNKGVKLSSGRYIWIAESDDYSDVTFLEKLVPVLDTHSNVGLVYAQSKYVNGEGEITDPDYRGTIWEKDFIKDGKSIAFEFLIYGNIIQNVSSALFRKEIYSKVGGADESFKIAGDSKLWIDFAFACDFGYVSEKLNYFRSHSGNVRSSKKIIGNKEAAEVLLYLLKKSKVGGGKKREIQNLIFHLWQVDAFNDFKEKSAKHYLSFLKILTEADPFFCRNLIKKIFRRKIINA